MPAYFKKVFLNSTGSFLPGPAVNNDEMDSYIGSINTQSNRIKRRILAENGIKSRHYGIDKEGRTMFSSADMAIKAIEHTLENTGVKMDDVQFLSTGTVGADMAAPGFANLVQGQLRAAPMQTMSFQGICASGVAAMKAAASVVELGEFDRSMAVATEFPSRLFKASRFQQVEENLDFDSHFLRWMLSDGSGAVLMENKPRETGVSLKLDWIHLKSFSGDYPTCMQIGAPWGSGNNKSYLDYSSLAEAEKAGSFLLRQDIRLLPNLFDVGISEFIDLVLKNEIQPNEVDHFLCHYSSERFSGVVNTLMDKAGLRIPPEKWFSNLTSKGNTGAASIFIMLDEFMKTKKPKIGEKILCFIPESGRFTVSFMLFEVMEDGKSKKIERQKPERKLVENLLLELGSVWHSYRSNVFRTEFANKIFNNNFSVDNYQQWMENWIPQVREGSVWMRTAIKNLSNKFEGIQELIEEHAGEEQFDFKVLYADYQNSGGKKDIDDLKRNPGGEALNKYMYERANGVNPLGLLGGIFIIEGTGQKIIPTMLPFLKKSLNLQMNVFKFLEYHGENDVKHLERWANAVELALTLEPEAYHDILATAKEVARLYHAQWEQVL